MSALPSLPPPEPNSRELALAQLRNDLVRRFPGAVASPIVAPAARREGSAEKLAELRRQSFLWLEVAVGQGGLAWLAAWTLLRLADDPLGRPALWIDTHCTLTPGDLLDLEGRLVVVRPADAHEAHVAADIALRSGSFSIVALEMHRALHPTALARLSRLANARRVGAGTHTDGDAHTPLILWGEPPPFLAPPSGIARTPFADAVSALLGDPRLAIPPPRTTDLSEPAHDADADDVAFRAPHTTDRLRPLDRAADRRASPSPPRAPARGDLVDPDPHEPRTPDRDDDAPFPYSRARAGKTPR